MNSSPLSLRGQIEEVDGLRGIAIFLVLVSHYWPHQGPLTPLLGMAVTGWIGVDLFFVISGFLITGILLDTYGDPNYYRNFYSRRILRIFPLYYLTLFLIFFVVPFLPGSAKYVQHVRDSSGSPLWYFFYVGNLRETLVGQTPTLLLAPLWSLAIEEQFYLSFPSVVGAFRPRLKSVLWTMIVSAPLFRLAITLLYPGGMLIQYSMTLSRTDVIAMGCLLALMLREGKLRLSSRLSTMLMAGSLFGLFLMWYADGLEQRSSFFCKVPGYSWVAFTFSTVLLWTVLHRGQRSTAILRFRPLCYLGKICYGTYLWHLPVGLAVWTVVRHLRPNPDPNSVWLMIGKFMTVLMVASASWYGFEKPILRFKAFFDSEAHPSKA